MLLSKRILPAEWEPQDGVMITWPNADTDWAPYLTEITQTYLALAKTIAQHEKLIIAAQDPDNVQKSLSEALSKEELARVSVYPCPINDTWARDHGPITVRDTADGSRQLLDFKFNGWGEKFAWQKDNDITRNLFRQGAFKDSSSSGNALPGTRLEDHTDFVLEGGSIESDGKGTVFTTAQCLLAPHRNQPMDEQEITEKLKDTLGAERIVWLHHGNLIGDDTDGHIDTIVRICPNDTLAYVGCEDKDDAQYADFRALEEELKTLRTTEGKPYRLLKLPMPDAMMYEGERLPATYANFLIINGAVILPVYNQPIKDQEALRIVQTAFPDREIIPLDASVIVRQHGSIHCITMQIPK